MKSYSSVKPIEEVKNNVMKTLTVFDKKTDLVLFKTTGDDNHLQKYGAEIHKKLEGKPFSVKIEDAPLFGFDFEDVQKAASKITVERVLIVVNLLISSFLVLKLLGK